MESRSTRGTAPPPRSVFSRTQSSRSEHSQCLRPIYYSTYRLPTSLQTWDASLFSSGAEKNRLNDDRALCVLISTPNKHGSFSLYYFADGYNQNNPYPSGFGGATVPGFNALSNGLTQLAVLSHTISFGPTAVNEARVSFTRLNNQLGTPQGGVGVSLASQGFATGPTGIQPGFPKYEGVETLSFNTFTIGTNPFSWDR